jgi:anti-sigma factor RsiW
VNCRETEGLLAAYGEGELGQARRREVETHLRDCPACTAELRRLAAIRAGGHPSWQPALAAPKAGRWPMVALAAGACVVAFVALGTVSRSGGLDAALAKEVVSAHVRSLQANHLLDVGSADWHTVAAWFTGKLDFAPVAAPPDGFELAGGRLDYLDGRNVAALIYRFRQHTINLFTWPGGADEAPEPQSLQGFHVIRWVRGGMNFWAVSDLDEEQLKRLAER